MTKQYDNGIKRLLAICAQDFLDWLIPGAFFTGKLSQEFESVTIVADAMHETLFCEKLMLVHMEAQSGPDPLMEQRLLEYNVLAYRYYKCAVRTVVISLRKGGVVASSPLVRVLPNGEEVLRFHFKVVLLWDTPHEELLNAGLLGLLPLVPLAKGGATYEVVEEVIARLLPADDTIRRELLALTQLFASLAFDKDDAEEQSWLKRRFAMLEDILRETPAYQWILEEGREEGLQKGREEGLQKGREEGLQKGREEGLKALRELLIKVVQMRFPKLKVFAKAQAVLLTEPVMLEELITKIMQAQTIEEAQSYLLQGELADE